jgi:hypothetical protein
MPQIEGDEELAVRSAHMSARWQPRPQRRCDLADESREDEEDQQFMDET